GPSGAEPVTEMLADTRGAAAYDMRESLRPYVKDFRIFYCASVPAPWDPNRLTIPLPSPRYLESSYVAFFGRALGVKDFYMLKPGQRWLDGDGERRTPLMADRLYYSANQSLVHERGSALAVAVEPALTGLEHEEILHAQRA